MATGLCGHPGAKTVGTLALEYAGLKCSFHIIIPNKNYWPEKEWPKSGKKVVYSIEMAGLIQSN